MDGRLKIPHAGNDHAVTSEIDFAVTLALAEVTNVAFTEACLADTIRLCFGSSGGGLPWRPELAIQDAFLLLAAATDSGRHPMKLHSRALLQIGRKRTDCIGNALAGTARRMHLRFHRRPLFERA